MSGTIVNVAEGKKGFSRLIREAADKKEEVIVTKRGRPVAVILPYDDYLRSKKGEGYRKIAEARAAFSKTGIKAKDVYKESRKQLEKKS